MLFPATGITKLDLVHYYLSVADGALGGAGGRPNMLVRRPNGIAEEFFFQKRAPAARPTWIEVVTISFPSGRNNQNAKNRTLASAYSVRPTPDARVSAPLDWAEVPDCDPADFTLPARFATRGDLHAAMDRHPGSLASLLEQSAREERDGVGDAPWPPITRSSAANPRACIPRGGG